MILVFLKLIEFMDRHKKCMKKLLLFEMHKLNFRHVMIMPKECFNKEVGKAGS